jgi:phosphoadenosine phosphosulfate reductase
MKPSLVDILAPRLAALDLDHRLRLLREFIPGRIVFTTSFGIEDQLIAHSIFTQGLDIDVVTIDTGRLFPQTYELWEKTEARYAQRISAVYPQAEPLQQFVAEQGVNGFYKSVENRKTCCHLRKVEPLARLLAGATAWITGLRADQSSTRAGAALVEFDAGRKLLKLNPLLDYTRDAIVEATAEFSVPVNELHAQGFVSIGCAPCTRALEPGEPERAGRWWWEEDNKKECGLHVDENGAPRRGPAPLGEAATPEKTS